MIVSINPLSYVIFDAQLHLRNDFF